MRSRTVVLMAIVAAVYFLIKMQLLQSHQPFWVRIGTAAMFWGTLAVVGYFSERASRSKSS